MENVLYITLEQDLIRLENQLKSLDSLIDMDKFKAYGRYAHVYERNYVGFDKKRSRTIARKTMRNVVRSIKSINKKIKLNKDITTLQRTLELGFRAVEMQMLFT
jgi:hypothetical protein